MIGLLVLGAAVVWLIAAGFITRFVVRLSWFKRAPVLSEIVIYPFIVAAPFLDEVIGRWQFRQLCNAEAKVYVAPNAKDVVAARPGRNGTSARSGFLFPVTEQAVSYFDARTGETFYSFKAFHTPGGFVMRSGLNLGHSTSCWPEKWTSRENGFDL